MSLPIKEQKNPIIHLEYLDGLRALLALYVVIHHSIKQFDLLVQKPNSLIKLFFKPFVYGHYAVDSFIVLSGFCLMLPVIQNNGFLRGNIIKFYKSRARRILPTYYLAMVLSLLLIYTLIEAKTGTLWDWSIPVSFWDITTHLVLIQDLFLETATKINYTFWSISVEWRIYFFFPLLVILFRKLGAFKTTIYTILVSIMALVALSYTSLNLRDFGINPQYFGLFTLGMLSAYASFSTDYKAMRLKALLGWKTIAIIFPVSFLLFITGHYLKSGNVIDDTFAIRDIIFGLFMYCFLAWIALGRLKIIRKVLSWKPLVFVGTFAYSIYLIHAPLLQVIGQYILKPLNLSLPSSISFLLIVGTLIIIVLSYLFFLCAERPFMNKKGKIPRFRVKTRKSIEVIEADNVN